MPFFISCDVKAADFLTVYSEAVCPAHSSVIKSLRTMVHLGGFSRRGCLLQHYTGLLRGLSAEEWNTVDGSRRGCTTVWFKSGLAD